MKIRYSFFAVLVFLRHLCAAPPLWEFNADSLEKADPSHMKREAWFDSMPVFKMSLATEIHEKSVYRKSLLPDSLPLRDRIVFRFVFGFDTLFCRNPEAAGGKWPAFDLLKLITDDYELRPTQSRLLRYRIALEKRNPVLLLSVYHPEKNVLVREDTLAALVPHKPLCLETEILLDSARNVREIRSFVNLRAASEIPLNPSLYPLRKLIPRFGHGEVHLRWEGALYLSAIAVSESPRGAPPAPPRFARGILPNRPPVGEGLALPCPSYRPFLTAPGLAAVQCRIYNSQWGEFPVYDSGPDSLHTETLKTRTVFPAGAYTLRARHFDSLGNSSAWSIPLGFSIPDSGMTGRDLAIRSAGLYGKPDDEIPCSTLVPGKSYLLKIRVANTGIWNRLGYAVVWLNGRGYTEGNADNRGGRFLRRSSIVVNFSLYPHKIYEKNRENLYRTTIITGSAGRVVDARPHILAFDSVKGEFRCGLTLPIEADPGDWMLRAVLRDRTENSSPLFISRLRVEAPETGRDSPGSRFFFLAGLIVLFMLLLLFTVRRKRLKSGDMASEAAVHPPSRDQETVAKFDAFVRQNLNRDISMAELEKIMMMGHANLYRIVKNATSKSLIDYILDLKMEKAAQLFKTTALNVTEVMMECGFDNPAYFSRLFKKRMKISPRDFRAQASLPHSPENSGKRQAE